MKRETKGSVFVFVTLGTTLKQFIIVAMSLSPSLTLFSLKLWLILFLIALCT